MAVVVCVLVVGCGLFLLAGAGNASDLPIFYETAGGAMVCATPFICLAMRRELLRLGDVRPTGRLSTLFARIFGAVFIPGIWGVVPTALIMTIAWVVTSDGSYAYASITGDGAAMALLYVVMFIILLAIAFVMLTVFGLAVMVPIAVLTAAAFALLILERSPDHPRAARRNARATG